MSVKTLPDLVPDADLHLPHEAERRLSNGLTVIAIRRSAVPLVELRLRIPFGRAPLAPATLLSQALFTGTSALSSIDLAAELQAVGGSLAAGLDPDRLLISGNALADGLDRTLELLAGVLTDATYPAEEVATERERLVDSIQVALSQPAHLVRVALLKRIYDTHPYAVQTPTPDEIRSVEPAGLRELHAERVRPAGATLVLVGDIDPDQAIDVAEKVLGGWTGSAPDGVIPATPEIRTGPLLLVDRPGSVQSSLRLALPGITRTDPDYAAFTVANLIFGGYFSSRWVENIREDKGYTYGSHSVVEHFVAGSTWQGAAEVATEVTGPSLLETLYELGRIASLPPGEEELEQARRYALGTLRLGMSTQSGLAGLASVYAGFGLRLEHLREHSEAIAAVTREEVFAAGARYLAPSRAVTVVLGDADKIESQLSVLTAVERSTE
ncbi:putative M16-family peptidase [Actinoplanes missouriensis 431]|uniref:Putative M16-family peptidase n=1 Tax=Actinoplanes missouriensis (strain ATCC 14538 / DSM 43046 / CBS 188.64 / JCM 3121 / NBRC 102363 / NCIMB 12654 / NRRL B-3342 / UNCC 431) TaxID=512565 RepID=I0HHS1_ACTM4|nr:pitrilysin family protein [Actinoplanes missouriensis]BAL92558.1 putative M16-family peptidase [Actinoplanes missouriensis 431]